MTTISKETGPKEAGLTAADFTAMADNLPEPAWMTDAEGAVIWYNQRWYAYTGGSFEQMSGWGWRDFHDPAELADTEETWRRSLATGKPFELTFKLRGKDGVLRPFLSRAAPLRDASGAITKWFGVSTDISTLQETTLALAGQTRIAETLNRTAAKVAAELNLEQMVQMVTDAAVQLTGAEFGAFFYNVIKRDGESYTLYTISGVPREKFSKFPMPRNTDVFAPTFHGTGIVRSADITQDPRYGHNAPHKGMPEGHLPVRSYLAAPVISRRGEVMGGLFFGHSDTNRFDADDEQIVAGLAAQAAIGIDNSRLYENAQREILERKMAEEERLLALRELNHRVKNLFAMATGMVGMTARTSPSTRDMADTLTGRLRALAKAHELIRATAASPDQAPRNTTVRVIVESLLEAHLLPEKGQLEISGPDIPAGSVGAAAFAQILHELATNASKYGALSDIRGKLSITWQVKGSDLIVTWVETGGPAVSGPPTRKGFGADLAAMNARGQLGGDIAYDWRPEGLAITLRASLDKLSA